LKLRLKGGEKRIRGISIGGEKVAIEMNGGGWIGRHTQVLKRESGKRKCLCSGISKPLAVGD